MNTSDFLDKKNLDKGIAKFKDNWPKEADFHYYFYCKVGKWRIETNWPLFVDELWCWKAIRPKSKKTTIDNGQKKLKGIGQKVDQLRDKCISNPKLAWCDLEPIFKEIQQIKPAKDPAKDPTPVFPSKLGHFLLPHLFIVTDGDYTRGAGFKNYGEYWTKMAKEWRSLDDASRTGLREILMREIQTELPDANLDSYPFATKIIELCTAGAKAIRNGPLSEAPPAPAP